MKVCSICHFELFYPIEAEVLQVTKLGLYSDARFPGRVLLVYERHVEGLEQLEERELTRFWSDATATGRAISRMTGAARINYAVLGNALPHLHVHLIPRFPSTEPLPTRPPWSDSREMVELPSNQVEWLTVGLKSLLRRPASTCSNIA